MKFTTSIALLTALAVCSQTAIADHQHSDHHHTDHHPHGSLHTASGMLLGVYARTTHEGLIITGTIPGYSAEGRLFAGDILLKATAANLPVFTLRSHQDMERAKSQIGPFREAAIEFFRPGVGNLYAWVTFQPVGGDVHSDGHDDGHPHVLNEQAPPPQGGSPHVHSPGPIAHNGGQPLNPNNQTPFSSNIPSNPNNFQPKSGSPPSNPNNFSPYSATLSSSPNNFSPHSGNPASTGKFQAEFRLESEKPGARLLFKNPGGINLSQPPQTNLPQSTQPQTRTFRFRGRNR